MANYEKQEAAYPIPISLYNCYRTVRHRKQRYRDGVCSLLFPLICPPHLEEMIFIFILVTLLSVLYTHSLPASLPLAAGVKLVNDTVIADPLFTAPVGDGSTHFCYEVHGTPNTIFNLVSDKCTVVNAEYVPMIIPSNGNVIGAVGVRAADSAGNCHNIEVRFSQSGSGLDAFVDGEEVSGVTRVDSVQVRRYSNRVRISVPNCELVDLVMWVIMVEMMGQNMIKFVITRGVNLAPTSHGLVGEPVYTV